MTLDPKDTVRIQIIRAFFFLIILISYIYQSAKIYDTCTHSPKDHFFSIAHRAKIPLKETVFAMCIPCEEVLGLFMFWFLKIHVCK